MLNTISADNLTPTTAQDTAVYGFIELSDFMQ